MRPDLVTELGDRSPVTIWVTVDHNRSAADNGGPFSRSTLSGKTSGLKKY
jgi:hypothetical protein